MVKLPSFAGCGGCWFRADEGDAIAADVHLGVDAPVLPAKKAHPGLVLDSSGELEATVKHIADAGCELSWAERDTLEGYMRFHGRDGFGNRIEGMTLAV